MEELIHKLGIEPKLLIAQIINFGILLLLLYRFLYKPVLGVLQKREDYIKKSLEEAKNAEKKNKEFEERKLREMKKVKDEANVILEKAILDSEKIKNETLEKAKSATDELLEKAKKEINSQKDQMLLEARKEVGDLVIMATSKIVGRVIDKEDEKELINDTVKNISGDKKDILYSKV